MEVTDIGFRPIAQRMYNAVIAFEKTLQAIVPMDDKTATRVATYYCKHKLAVMDANNGVLRVKHGALLSEYAVAAAIIESAS